MPEVKMRSSVVATQELVLLYQQIFVNRRAYTVQSPRPHPKSGKHYYYRPKVAQELSAGTLKLHLEGEMTIGLYAINPRTQRCKWVAIDADYKNAIDDLLKLQWELRQVGVEAALERSRRGGHLWIFAAQPLLARDCRLYINDLAQRLKLPIKGASLSDGIEVFPKQDLVLPDQFGNAMRGPLGVHRASGKRYWFYGADYALDAQLDYLARIRKISASEMATFVAGLKVPTQVVLRHRIKAAPIISGRREFQILQHVQPRRKEGRNYWAQCPSCAQQGRDRSRDNLAIAILDPRKYRCWAGCTKEMIRSALGVPIATHFGS